MQKTFTFLFLVFFLFLNRQAFAQGIGINETGATPDPNAILDVASTSKGLLIPRLTTSQRDAISSPPAGLQIYNTSTNTIDIYRGQVWESLSFSEQGSNAVKVQSLTDLPAPQGSEIMLDANKVYIFSGIVNISPYYLNVNGAAIKGIFPEKDGITSNVNGAIIRSSDNHVYVEKMAILPNSSGTSAFNLSDATGVKICNLMVGTNVIDAGAPSLGVGSVSGFKSVTISNNYWKTADGIKVRGNVGAFAASHNIILNITAGSAFEFVSGLNIDAIDLSNNYFTYSGQIGVHVNGAITFNHARLTTNMFNGVGEPLRGFDTTTPGWEMKQNAGVADSRVYGSLHMNNNTTLTSVVQQNQYSKIAGSTTSVKLERFSAPAHNTLQYTGKYDISGKVYVGVAGASHANGADITVAIAKNGTAIPMPAASIRGLSPNQSFHMSFVAEVDLVTGDFIEVFIKSNVTGDINVTDMQMRITD
ncbi:MAG: hypothetical protein LPJ89_06170 [Hymenobacteraceae bacterium]|nr:hypothetical protein [Hymenobacteraceae bacterium]MDX5395095.1 hypothetical protein [Hymenobacteraceae bacterium]MDX5443356.1 hypothetical protein [Hymenobacteraceae bacterium]MDX5511133.1 hypothetical protein [Hymenobacteraceae bacterium]